MWLQNYVHINFHSACTVTDNVLSLHAHTHTPVSVTIRQGFPVLAVPLPSRNESCDFILRPHLQTVGDFINHVKAEDGGVDRYTFYLFILWLFIVSNVPCISSVVVKRLINASIHAETV